MNLTAIQAAIQAKGYGADTAAQQLLFINEVYREVCGMMRWPFLEASDTSLQTVVGQTQYTLPFTNWRNLDSVRLEQPASQNYVNLNYDDPQSFMDRWHVDRDNGTPCYWTMKDSQLWFYPTPDDVYNVRVDYIVEPVDLAAGTDVPVIPLQYHDILVWGAVVGMCFRERDWLGRQFALTAKEQMLKRLEEEYLIRQRQSGSHVKKSGRGGGTRVYPFSHGGG